MSILIKGMETPKNCWDCPLINTKPCPCKGYSTALEHITDRHTECPLVPVPPHGDLIDRDALMNGEGRYLISFGKEGIDVAEINRAPTIIPEEEG